MPNGRARDPHKEQFWRRHVQRWQDSGLSVRDYCDRHRLAEPSFYAWRRTLAQRDDVAPPVATPPPLTFLPLTLSPATTAEPTSPLEIVLTNGRRLRVPVGFDATTLRAVLALLEDAPC